MPAKVGIRNKIENIELNRNRPKEENEGDDEGEEEEKEEEKREEEEKEEQGQELRREERCFFLFAICRAASSPPIARRSPPQFISALQM